MGYFDEDLDVDNSGAYRISSALKHQIGEFFVAWSRLESELEVAFHVLFRIDPNLASCIYANLGTQTKIDILTSSVDALWNALGKNRVVRLQSILAKVRVLNDRGRNTLAHGYHFSVPDDKTKKYSPSIVRAVARKQITLVIHPGDVKYWRRATRAVDLSASSLRKALIDIHKQLKKFSDDQLWEATGVQSRVAEPIVLRRRKRQPPKKVGSKGHRPKRGKRLPSA